MELVQITNFLNGRYLISNMRNDKTALLGSGLLSSFSVGNLGNSYNEKIYYDTKDFFFADKGINIYTVNINGNNRELIVRYDSEQVKRIEFLKNIPNFFKLKIGLDESIANYLSKISEAIYKVYPSGLNVNIEEMLRNSSPEIKIFKKRESYRVVNNTGLKMVISFDYTEYSKFNNPKQKFVQPTLDIVGENYKKKEDFQIFLKSVIRDFPKLIKLDSNELTVARKSL